MAIGSESVPIGVLHARDARASCRPTQEKAILANVRSNEPDVKGIVGKLTQGAADAGFVYVTDVNATGGDLKAIKLPDDARAAGDLRRRASSRGAKQPELGRRSSSTGCTDGDCADALAGRGLRPRPVTRSAGSRSLLGVCAGGRADVPHAAGRRDLRRLEPGAS